MDVCLGGLEALLTTDQEVSRSGREFERDVLEARGSVGEGEGEILGGDVGSRHLHCCAIVLGGRLGKGLWEAVL